MPRSANPNLRPDLLRAAVALLDQRGDADFSMRDLSAQVDYAVTAVYRTFRSRAHLLRALQMTLFEGLAVALFETPLTGDSVEQIVELGDRFMSWAVAHPGRYRFMFHSTEPEALLDEADQALARAPLRTLEGLLTQAAQAGALEVEDPAAAAVMLFATLHGLLSLHLAQRLDPDTVADPVEFYRRWVPTWLATMTRPAHLGPEANTP